MLDAWAQQYQFSDHNVVRYHGENVWLLLPRDEGVFDGATTAGGVTCVSPVQVYLDRAAHPERSKAAETLRAELLNWRAT